MANINTRILAWNHLAIPYQVLILSLLATFLTSSASLYLGHQTQKQIQGLLSREQEQAELNPFDSVIPGRLSLLQEASATFNPWFLPSFILITGLITSFSLYRFARLSFQNQEATHQEAEANFMQTLRLYQKEAADHRKSTQDILLQKLDLDKKFQFLFESIQDVYYRADADGILTTLSPSCIKSWGYSPNQLIGQNFLSLFHNPTDYEDLLQSLITYREVRDYEVQLINQQGEIRYYSLNALIIIDPETGTLTGSVGTLRDLTSRKLSEQSLKRSEIQFRHLYNQAPVIMYTIDAQGRIREVNQKWIETTGYSSEEILYQPSEKFLPHLQARRMTQDILPKLWRDGAVHEANFQIRRKDEQIIDVVWDAVATVNPLGEKVGFVVLQDVSARRLAERALAEEKQRLDFTLSSISDAVITTDLNGHIQLLNFAAEQIIGWRLQEAKGQWLPDIYQTFCEITQQPRLNPMEWVFQNPVPGKNRSKTVILRSRDNREFQIEENCAPILDQDGHFVGVVLVFRDISERKRMETEMIKTSKNDSISLLAGGVAHDFNNILTGIVGNISLLRMALQDQNHEYDNSLEEIERATLRASDLTRQLLTFSKGGSPIKQTSSIEELFLESIQFSLRGTNVRCKSNFEPDLPPVEVDAGQMNQVINNLIINAIQAMPHGGIIRIRGELIELSQSTTLPLPTGHYLRISIEDQGSGIAPENLSKIFDPYFTTKRNGNGLGLATAYSILRKHDGLLTAESILAKGSTFSIYLPASTKPIPAPKFKQEKIAFNGSGRILVMDDESAIRNMLRAVLNRIGYEVAEAEDGAVAIELYLSSMLNGNKFDAVIMDLTIPGGVGGKETIEQLLEIDPQVLAILSSGYANDPTVVNYQNFGFKGLIHKPYRIEELASLLTTLIHPPEFHNELSEAYQGAS